MNHFKWSEALMHTGLAIELDGNRSYEERDIALVFSTPNAITYGDLFGRTKIQNNPNPYRALFADVDTTPHALSIVARKVKADTGKRLRDWSWDDLLEYLKDNWMDIAKTVASILIMFI